MPHRIQKINDIVRRVERARSAAAAFRLAGDASNQPGSPIYWPDLMHVVESTLPTPDELDSALQCLNCAGAAATCPCGQTQP